MKEKFLEFQKSEDGKDEILLYGPIRKQSLLEKIWEVEAEDGRMDALTFEERLKATQSEEIVVRINSYGGSVSEGLAIYNALRKSGKQITTICEGFACSVASVIYCAGDKRIMPETSLLMIHNAWTEGGEGNANHFRKLAEDLDKITQPSVRAYVAVSNLSENDIKALMDNETWIEPEQALEWGFATEIRKCATEASQELEQRQILNLVKNNNMLSTKVKDLETQIEELTKEPTDSWANFFNGGRK